MILQTRLAMQVYTSSYSSSPRPEWGAKQSTASRRKLPSMRAGSLGRAVPRLGLPTVTVSRTPPCCRPRRVVALQG
jgi:hypothetical protein